VDSGFKYRIPVADDDAASLASTAAALSKEGYLVLSARDGFDALAELQSGVPEVVVSELRMPNMSGFELLPLFGKDSRVLASLREVRSSARRLNCRRERWLTASLLRKKTPILSCSKSFVTCCPARQYERPMRGRKLRRCGYRVRPPAT